ncbi:ArnT family glycosyltransferase [Halocatena salina]|uniref:Glycosyltransferase family 39 protein n=1 Tax=Halocatena salina TaxID=2934340 RepID=A0A8U0A4F4_9EURY|nr:glycosyltransferase family 39 protein [Halocatena salina]UPM43726.1 glycosyltransferase family 39 protein [Halocatena salina]
MWRAMGDLLGRAKQQVTDDLKTDPYLPYILVAAAVFAGFWFWHRIPNFATRDERWRINNVMVAVGYYVEEPTLESFLDGIARGRAYGASFYLFGIALLPVFAAAVVFGQLEAFTTLPEQQAFDLWAHWLDTPRWIWTWGLLFARLINVVVAIACVYVTYRIGVTMRDRLAGRLSAFLLTVTWGFLAMAHEVGEDVPALLCFLLVVYCALRYAETGDRAVFLAGCVFGGLGIAFKLTAGIGVILLGVAYVLYGFEPDTEWSDALVRPGLLGLGLILGVTVIVVGYPSVFGDGIERIIHRMDRGTSNKSNVYGWLDRPSWWWLLRGYLDGLGLPLFSAGLASVAMSVPRLWKRSSETNGVVLSLVCITTLLIVFARWSYIRTHHLLLTFPLVVLLVGVGLARLHDHDRSLARPIIAVLVVSSSVYAGIGVLGYATQPRDEATDWLQTHADEDAVIETYVADPQEAAIPHGMTVSRPRYEHMNENGDPVARETYTGWIQEMPQRCPEYIELTYHNGILHLAPDDWNVRAERLSWSGQTDYYRALLAEDTYPYSVAATFGPRPAFLDQPPQRNGWLDLLGVGVNPRSIQYGDPQDFGRNQYTVILERTGSCSPPPKEP